MDFDVVIIALEEKAGSRLERRVARTGAGAQALRDDARLKRIAFDLAGPIQADAKA